MSLSSVLLDAVQQAKPALGDLLLTGKILKKASSSYNTTTGVKTKLTTEQSFQFVYEILTVNDVEELGLRLTDIKVLMLDVPSVPDNGDTVKLEDDVELQVVRALPVRAGAEVVVCPLFLRR